MKKIPVTMLAPGSQVAGSHPETKKELIYSVTAVTWLGNYVYVTAEAPGVKSKEYKYHKMQRVEIP